MFFFLGIDLYFTWGKDNKCFEKLHISQNNHDEHGVA